MNAAEIQRALDEVHDLSLMRHGYTHHSRDYELLVRRHGDPRSGMSSTDLRYLFRYCVEADVRTTLGPRVWRASLDDRLTDMDTADGIDGHVWVTWQDLHPGGTVVRSSERARRWVESVGIDFHEIVIESNVHVITLIASDLQVVEVDPG
jgi:hypothetical protein